MGYFRVPVIRSACARHAQALAAAGEPEQAVAIAAGIPPQAVKTGSARMRSELFTLQKCMEPWSQEPAGRALEELLLSFSEKSSGRWELWHHETRY